MIFNIINVLNYRSLEFLKMIFFNPNIKQSFS